MHHNTWSRLGRSVAIAIAAAVIGACASGGPGALARRTAAADALPPLASPLIAPPDWVASAIDNEKRAPPPAAGDFSGGGFEENHGQFDGDADLIGRDMAGATVLLHRGGFSLLTVAAGAAPDARGAPGTAVNGKARAVDVAFGESPRAERCVGSAPLTTRFAYFRGSNRKDWITGVPVYRAASCRSVFRDIDLAVRAAADGFEYDFVVAPGADPQQIRMRVTGADRLRLSDAGDLLMQVGASELQHSRPIAYQERDGRRVAVESNFVLEDNVVRLRVGDYDRSAVLIIDPRVTQRWASTPIGGPFGHSKGNGIAAGADGRVYAAGWANVFSTMTRYSRDAFLAVHSADGAQIFVATFSGATTCANTQNLDCNADEAVAVAVDANGLVYLTGNTTSFDFPVLDAVDSTCGDDTTCTRGADPNRAALPDAFVLKLAPGIVLGPGGALVWGLAPVWGTYLGGAGTDYGNGIALDPAGNVYVAGFTNANLAITLGSSPSGPIRDDGFLVAYQPIAAASAMSLRFAMRIGGSSTDNARAVAADANFVYVAGSTCSWDFAASDPWRKGGASVAGGCDAFVSRFDHAGLNGSSTFVRGSSFDEARGVAVDGNGSVYVVGSTTSSNFNGAITPRAGGSDGFLAKLSYTGTGFRRRTVLNFAQLFGGSNEDIANGVALDRAARAYVVGMTRSTNFPVVGDRAAPFHSANSGGLCGSQNQPCGDAFVLRLTDASALDYTALWGGPSMDSANAVALRAPGDVVFAAESHDAAATIPQWRAFAVRAVSGSDLALAKSCQPDPVHAGSSLVCTLTVSNAGPEDSAPLLLVDRPQQRAQFDISAPGNSACQQIYDAQQRIDRITCGLRGIAANSSASVAGQLLPLIRGPFTNLLSLDYLDDWNPGNNTVTATVNVRADTNLSVFKSHLPEPTPLGTDTTYEIWVSNNGPDVASAIALTEQIPAGMQLLSVSTPVGTCAPTRGQGPLSVDCRFDLLTHTSGPSGISAVGVTLVARAAAAGVYRNTASVSGAVAETDPADNTMTDLTNVIVGKPRIRVSSNVIGRMPVAGGTQVRVELETRNTGDGNAKDLRFTQLVATASVGSGVIQTLSALPPDIALVGPGRGRSDVAVLLVPAGVSAFELVVGGEYLDFSGSATPLPFASRARLMP